MNIIERVTELEQNIHTKENAFVDARVRVFMAKYDLHRDHYIILRTIMDDEKNSKKTVPSPMMNLDVAKGLADELLEKGMIAHNETANGGDFVLTDKGSELFIRIENGIKEAKAEAYSALDDSELEALEKILQKMNNRLEETQNDQ